ncbi:unnamed protein product [Amoebophrya sp. A120]|nr:unnamed protein product [Amoebophrya sp. A120]|eukprot:GSA120T00021221001.1
MKMMLSSRTGSSLRCSYQARVRRALMAMALAAGFSLSLLVGPPVAHALQLQALSLSGNRGAAGRPERHASFRAARRRSRERRLLETEAAEGGSVAAAPGPSSGGGSVGGWNPLAGLGCCSRRGRTPSRATGAPVQLGDVEQATGAGNASSPSNECCICQEPQSERDSPLVRLCRAGADEEGDQRAHLAHQGCASTWIRTGRSMSTTCPECRQPMLREVLQAAAEAAAEPHRTPTVAERLGLAASNCIDGAVCCLVLTCCVSGRAEECCLAGRAACVDRANGCYSAATEYCCPCCLRRQRQVVADNRQRVEDVTPPQQEQMQ